MKSGLLAAAALFGSAVAQPHIRRSHAHDGLHKRLVNRAAEPEQSCACTTTVYQCPSAQTGGHATPTDTVHSTSYITKTAWVTASSEPGPSQVVSTFSSPGVYTVPEKTLTVSDTTTVCGATSTVVPPGVHTYGGVTTVVDSSTTVTCPIPVTSQVTSLSTTTAVCSSAGTCTIGGWTTSVPTSATLVYPTPAVYTPGTYTQPADIVTVTDTNSVYICPSTPVPAQPKTTAQQPAPSTPAQPQTTEQPPAPQTTPQQSAPTTPAQPQTTEQPPAPQTTPQQSAPTTPAQPQTTEQPPAPQTTPQQPAPSSPAPSSPAQPQTPASSKEQTTTVHRTSTIDTTSYLTVHRTPLSSAPSPSSPAPETSAPAPSPSSPAPETSSPAPSPSSPAPETSAPAPSTSSPAPASSSPASTSPASVGPTTEVPAPPPSTQPPAPTHHHTTFHSPGTYTIPETTITVTDTKTVCDATTTPLAPGPHTYGGVTTVVETATTVTCPVAKTSSSGTVVTSWVTDTTYVCPSAGTYTIGSFTTSVPSSTTVVYPTPTTITPGTYHQPSTVVTVTDTSSEYVCPATPTPVQATTTPAAAPSVSAATTASPTPTPQPATSTPTQPKSSSTPSPSSTPSNGGNGNGGKAYGMTFTPYTADGQCMQADEVEKHISQIASKGIRAVRIYSTDCNGLENVGNSVKKHGLKMIVGVYIDGSGISGGQKHVQELVSWGQWDLVELIVVGNEAIQNGYVSASDLASFITSAAGTFKKAGYTGNVTTTEPINVWEQDGQTLCSAVDVLGANLHPFFNAQTTAAEAGTFVKSQVQILNKICNGKKVLNLETGWPTAGNANGKAVPGQSEQTQAIKALIQEVGSESVFFSYENDKWKEPGNLGVEQFWGCIGQF